MKKQTLQFILGFFLIFSALPVFAEFDAEVIGLWAASSGCVSPATFQAACASDNCGDSNSSTADVACPNSGCPTGKNKWVWPCSAGAGVSCPQNSTKIANVSKCSCNTGYRQNTSIGLIETTISCDTYYNAPSDDILAYAIGAGLFAGGTGATFAACGLGANPACIASVLTAAAGAGLALATYLNSGDSSPAAASPDPCAGKTCISVQIDPNKPITGADTYVSRDSDGNFKPEGQGWNNNGDGTHSAPVTDGTVTVDTNTDRVTSTVTNSSGATSSTVVQSGNNGGGVEVISQGKTSGGDYTHQVKGGITGGAVVTTQEEAQTGTAPTGGFYQNGSIGGTSGSGSGSGSGDTGSGTGSGSGSGSGDCATYGCAKEVTLKEIRDELKNTRYDEAQQAKSDLNDLADEGINEAADRMDTMLQDMIDELGLDELFDEILDNLPIQQLIETNASNCSYGFSLLGKPYELSICQHQGTIHSVIAFLFFIALSFGIVSLIFERPQGSD